MNVRRNFKNLNTAKKNRIIQAILHMKNGPTDHYQKYVDWHRHFAGEAHAGIVFLAWHRIFIALFEKDLIQADIDLGNNGRIALPYWRWYSDRSRTPSQSRGYIWRSKRGARFIGFGGSGDSGDDFKVKNGPFKEGDWVVHRTAGVPAAPFDKTYLQRSLGTVTMPRARDARAAVKLTDFDVANFDHNAPSTSFRNVCEGFETTASGRGEELHNRVHMWVGGTISDQGTMGVVPISPNDPIFWLHHCNVDRLWAIWQQRHRTRPQYPSNSDIDAARLVVANPDVVKRLADPLLPWDGSGIIPGGSPSSLSISTSDVMSTRALGGALAGQDFRYDRNRIS